MAFVTYSNAKSAVLRAVCALLLIIASGFYFFLNLVDDYLALDHHRDSFYPDLIPAAIFFFLIIGALVSFFVNVFRHRGDRSCTTCLFLFVVCAFISLWFRSNTFYAADRTFLWANEDYFRTKISSDSATVVHTRSSVNFHKMIVYSGLRPIRDGRLSLEEIDALGTEFTGLRSCGIDSRYLKDDFYVLRTYC
jgi:hypothetical protein